MRQHLAVYRQLPGQTYLLSAGEFMLHLVNSAFLLIFNIYLSKLGYADSLIGSLTSMRYLGVLLAAIPIGLYIRGRLLRPLFLISGVGLPLVSCLLLWVVPWQVWSLTLGLMFLWGLLFVLMQVCIQPYMIRQVPPAHYAEAFALHYAVVPLSQVAAGGLIALAGIWMNPVPDERIILLGISGLGLLSVFFFARLQDNLGASTHPHTLNLRSLRGSYQWRRILRALIPTLLLATGAGFTFPFINLFFYQVFGIDSGAFGLMGAGSSLLVFGMVVAGPALKRQFGFGWTISGSQAIAVL
ncbi:MAG: MFS transporter, partial [Sphingobacteriia bacterium]